MSVWGWEPKRSMGIWRYGAGWLRPIVAAAPYLTVLLLLLQFHVVGGTLTSAKGVLFDLPTGGLRDGEKTDFVALAIPVKRDIVIFFDDSRYQLGDPASVRAFGQHLAQRIGRDTSKTLLVLVDRRICSGDLMSLAAVARESGVGSLLFAEKRDGRIE